MISRTVIRLLGVCSIVLLLTAADRKRLPSLGESVEKALANSPELRAGFLGIEVVRLTDGKTIYARNEDHLLVPASNTKLFSTALALVLLGPDYRFRTSIVTEGENLILAGGGDPSLSGRVYPYQGEPDKDQPEVNPLAAIEELADQVVAHGILKIEGDVIGDDTRYPWAPYPGGWSVSDTEWEYGAPVSALVVGDNSIDVTVTPGMEEGDPAQVALSPSFEFLTIENLVRTGAAGSEKKIRMDRRGGSQELHLFGSIPLNSGPDKSSIAVSDPAVFAAAALRDALIRRGVQVRGRAVARHRFLDPGEDPVVPVPGGEVAVRNSPPLTQILQVTDKVSENLHAELMLREVGAARRGIGTAKAGLAELSDFLAQAGITDKEYSLVDGSGLSRNSLVSPHAVVKLLSFMYQSRFRDQWIAMLPVGGQDGTLKNRFQHHAEAAAISAKTGSLGHVRALSGYATSGHYGRVAFSVLFNNYAGTDRDASRFLDTIGLKLVL